MLLKYKNKIYEYLKEEFFSINVFQIEIDGISTKFVHKTSNLWFKFFDDESNFNYFNLEFLSYTPNNKVFELPSIPEDYWHFDRCFIVFKNWVKDHIDLYIEENSLKDLWNESFSNFKNISFTNLINFEEFDNNEIEIIKKDINLIKEYITKFSISEENNLLIEQKLDYLINATDRLNKFDWNSVFINIILSITSFLLSIYIDKESINNFLIFIKSLMIGTNVIPIF